MVDLEPLRPLLAQQYILLTPNRRLAHRIRQALLWELPPGEVSATPSVFALGDWMEQLWLGWLGNAARPELVLTQAQELWLWQQVIREQAAGMSWLRPGAVAQQAASAYRQLLLWRVDVDQPAVRAELASGADSAAFLRWCDDFRQRARQAGWLTGAERDQRLVEQLQTGGLQLSKPVATLAFDDLAPLYRQLLDAAPVWHSVDAEPPPAQVEVIAADDPDQEIRRACRWLRQHLDTAASADGKAPTVALIVPDLGQRRARIERLLAEEWDPGSMDPAQPRRAPWINISAGIPLLDTPLAASGLRLLGLWQQGLSRSDAIALAQCPFAGQVFGDPRSVAWIEAVCDLAVENVSSAQLRACAQHVAQRCDEWPFAIALQRVAEAGRRQQVHRQQVSSAVWRDRFEMLLREWGWPARRLDSVEYQQYQLWRDALAEFAAMDVVAAGMDLGEALGTLRQLLQSKVFQPRIEDGALHVLGLLETAGLQFDAAWVCGMGASQWPSPAAPHPLLPRALQRRLRMPHCDAGRELEFSERISRGLLGLAPQLRISYARERDSVEQAVSPLFQAWCRADQPAAAAAVANQVLQYELQVGDGADTEMDAALEHGPDGTMGLLQQWITNAATPLQTLPPGMAPQVGGSERPTGGSTLFRSQSQCPFSAYARHRLAAEALTDASLGPTAMDRGQLLHRSLEFLWRKLGRREVLAALSAGQRQARVAEAVGVALDEWQGDRGWQGRERLRQLEQSRLETLLAHWLETVELPREEFTVVAVEQSRKVRFGPLELQLRADRIDRLADGRDLILDYKSGRCQPGDWLGERPAEPQLPLYAVLAEAERPGSVAGIAFAQLRAEGSQIRGYGDAGPVDEAPGVDWASCKRSWQAVMEHLAKEFVAGHAEVDPRQPPLTCRYCSLSPVCRYYHRSDAHQSDALPGLDEPVEDDGMQGNIQ